MKNAFNGLGEGTVLFLAKLCSVAKLFPTFWDSVYCSMPGFLSFTISWSFPNSRPLSWRHYPSISFSAAPHPSVSSSQSLWASGSFPMSQLFVLGRQSVGFQLHYQSPNEYSVLISFRVDWFDLLAVQGTLKSLLQHHNSKASVLHHSAFFSVQRSYLYMTYWKKTIALTLSAVCLCFLIYCLGLS